MKKKFLLNIICTAFTVVSFGQKDTLKSFRQFMTICNGVKQLPLHMQMQIQNSTNYVTHEDDTSGVNAEFFLSQQSSYIRYGDIEQVVNDSQVLVVNNILKQMIFFPNSISMKASLKNAAGFQLNDSSVILLSKRYSAEEINGANNAFVILKTRELVFNSIFPRETIELQYDNKRGMPVRVVQTRRSLVEIDSTGFESLSRDGKFRDRLVTFDDGYFLVKEQVSSYTYEKLTFDTVKVPVEINHRMQKNDAGEYVPVKQYEEYLLTQNQ